MASPQLSRRSFLLGLAGIVASVSGCSVQGEVPPFIRSQGRRIWDQVREQFRPVSSVDKISNLDNAGPFDVCIIGSGPAGAVLGNELVANGLRTLILESGLDLYQESPDTRSRELEVYQSSGDIDYPVVASRMRVVGGTSTIWTGRSSRLHPLDFEQNAYTPEGAAWPVGYVELEPYYERAEQTLRVAGAPLSEYHAPRKSDLPLSGTKNFSAISSMMDEVGITVDDSPTSKGVWASGPIRAATDLLPSFTDSPNGTLVSGVTATRLIADSRGNIEGVEIQTLDRETRVVPAQMFVVASGALETARLLLLSKSKAFPDGIGNSYDRVGRSFNEHPNIDFTGKISQSISSGSSQLVRCHQFYHQFKEQGFGSVILRFWWRPQEPEVLRIGATMEMYPHDSNRVTLASDLKDYFGNPGVDLSLGFTEHDLQTLEQTKSLIQDIFADLGASDVKEAGGISWSHHHMGTCRMGQDPTTGVVDRDLRVHESPNLYLLGSSVFVTSGAAHPTLAITAFAHRLAEHLVSLNVGAAQMNRVPDAGLVFA